MRTEDEIICFRCSISLASLSVNEQELHIKDCLSGGTKNETDSENGHGLLENNFICIACDSDLSRRRLISRCKHLKSCCKKNGIGTKMLLAMVAPLIDTADTEAAECGGGFLIDDVDGDNSAVVIENVQDDNNKENLLPKNTTGNDPKPKVNAFSFMMQSSKEHAAMKKLNNDSRKSLNSNAFSFMMNAISKKKDPNTSSMSSSSLLKWNRKGESKKRKVKENPASMFKKKLNAAGEIPYPPPHKIIKMPSMNRPIIVDGFQYATPSLSDCYFLTHFHSDHYGGLDKEFKCGRIFMTPVTAALVKLKLRPISGYIVPLEFNREYEIMVGDIIVKVHMLHANHCPGAACILFKFREREILHVGDFRWDRSLLQSSAIFQRLQTIALKGINRSLSVYLDTTYCDPKYCFPPQNEILDLVVKTTQNEMRTGKPLLVFGAYGIGKEKVFMATADALGCKVYCEKSRRQMMMCFDWAPSRLAKITTNPSESPVWVVPMSHLNFNSLNNLLKKASQFRYDRIVAFRPTGWSYSQSTTVLTSKSKDSLTLYSIPYSEHSSYDELIDFVKMMKPNIIHPTVNTSSKEEQLNLIRRGTSIYD
jgi:hypothetical protein